jgi:hypothetical protein
MPVLYVFLVKSRVEKFFDVLLYENVNDVQLREKFRKNFGFCPQHSYKLLSYNDVLAVALLHKDLLEDVVKNLKSRKKKLYPETKKCIVCELIKEVEERYTKVVLEYINDAEFKEKFLSSEGFCVPHFKLCLENIKDRPVWFLDFHLEKYKYILSSLEKYIESCNFAENKKINLTEEEKFVWKKIVKILF